MNDAPAPQDPRADCARTWAAQCLRIGRFDFRPASADASFRRYFRVTADSVSWIVMDAPPERENCEPFIRIAGLMKAAGLNVPEIIAQDLEQGFLLLSDLGRETYLNVIDEANADALFGDAIDALVKLQAASRTGVLPPYDRALLERELALFPDWFVALHLGRSFSDTEAALWRETCELLVASALDQPRVFVHRDWMPRNLMRSTPNPGVLDFQDAVEGPVTYDPVCLFRDAFLSWPAARVDAWVAQYRAKAAAAGIPMPPGDFRRAFDWMGTQRHLKVLGIFARIRYRDGKPHYLEDAPRFVRYVREVAGTYPELAPLSHLFDSLGLEARS